MFDAHRSPLLTGVFKVIDFGLARRYTDDSGAVLAQRPDASFRGSTTYASIHAHMEQVGTGGRGAGDVRRGACVLPRGAEGAGGASMFCAHAAGDRGERRLERQGGKRGMEAAIAGLLRRTVL